MSFFYSTTTHNLYNLILHYRITGTNLLFFHLPNIFFCTIFFVGFYWERVYRVNRELIVLLPNVTGITLNPRIRLFLIFAY